MNSPSGKEQVPFPPQGSPGLTNPLSEDLEHILTHTLDLWNEIRNQRLFITGGTGFFGCWLLEAFAWANDRLDLGAQAVVLTRNPAAFRRKAPHLASDPAIHLHVGDVRSFEFPDGPFSHVIHAATEASVKLNDENPALMFDTIVDGTRRTLEFARHAGARRLLMTSSGAVYGKQPSDLTHVPEEYQGAPDPADPRSAYGEGKRAAELLCVLYAGRFGIEAKIARCFAFVGPHLPLDTHFAIGNFIRDGLGGDVIRVNGDGTPYRSYLYVADLVIWLWTILIHGQSCRPFNVGSDDAITIGDLAAIVADTVAPRATVQIGVVPTPGKAPDRYVPSTRRASADLDLRRHITLREGICRTARWYAALRRNEAKPRVTPNN